MAVAKPKTSLTKWVKFFPQILIVSGLLGLFASISLSLDELKLLKNPNFQPVCNLNPLLSCTSVISSHQATALGDVPNPYLGLAAFAVIVTIGVALLAGAKFKKWFWQGLLAGATLGVLFIHWLFFQTVYNIGKLCLYCMLTWVVTITIFWYSLLINHRQGYLPKSGRLKNVLDFAARHHVDILIIWFLIIAGLILNHFWYFFGPH
ncbi:MAG: vitamin K epoxide reductase family protein [Candidatus Saccharimonadales bacterium]